MYGLLSLNNATLEKAALAYASMGWPVLPLNPREKTPMGRLVRNGLKQATTDIGQIRTWWEMYPACNIGLRTGDAFDVLDLDGREALVGLDAIATGYKHFGPVANTGKGWHMLFAPTGARNAANKVPKIDFRGQNGYIVAPPSIHPNGHHYQWVRDGDLPSPPIWLDRLVTPPSDFDQRERLSEYHLEPIIETWMNTFGTMPGHTPQPVGDRFVVSCVWHDDSTPSLVLYPHNNSFYCFGCMEWGDSMNITDSFYASGTSPSELRAAATARPTRNTA